MEPSIALVVRALFHWLISHQSLDFGLVEEGELG
jgi:hypothetical protein